MSYVLNTVRPTTPEIGGIVTPFGFAVWGLSDGVNNNIHTYMYLFIVFSSTIP